MTNNPKRCGRDETPAKKVLSLPRSHSSAKRRGWNHLPLEVEEALANHTFFKVSSTAMIGIGPPIPGQPNGSVYCITDPISGLRRCYPLT